MRMKELDVVLTRSIKKLPIASWGIMWWTGKDYSHCARKVIRRDWGAGYYQASEGNVNYEHESIFDKKHKIVKTYRLMIDASLEMKIREACWKECGKKYGTLQNVGIVLTDILLKIFRKEIENPWKKGRNCSEILYAKCFKILIPELDIDENKIKPHQIEEIILKHFKQNEAGYWVLSTTV